jgi:hypothetical protein
MKFIELLFNGPPSADALQFIEILDDHGNKLSGLGEFYHDGQHWRLQIPTELVPRMVVNGSAAGSDADDAGDVDAPAKKSTSVAKSRRGNSGGSGSSPQAQRKALKERVMGKAEQLKQSASATTPPGKDWVKCPGCKKLFDPHKDDIQSCPQCGEDLSTACCLPNPTKPCLDCDALNDSTGPDADDDTGAPSAAASDDPIHDRLFDNQVHAVPGMGDDADDDD